MHTKKSFLLSIAALLTAILIMVVVISLSPLDLVADPYALILNIMMVLLAVISLIGFVLAIKALKEPGSIRKYFALAVHSLFLLFFLYVLVINVNDLLQQG